MIHSDCLPECHDFPYGATAVLHASECPHAATAGTAVGSTWTSVVSPHPGGGVRVTAGPGPHCDTCRCTS